jgi:3'-phosphoadenosine 5'-phosphosulfate sulfotransferase (PAPS reductase)/FAD synthetase
VADAIQEGLFAAPPIGERVAAARAILDEAEESVRRDGKTVAATVILFSGGDDSTVLAHMFRDRVTHIAHCNTGIGIEETRQFVRDMSVGWGIPLLEKHLPEGKGYRDLVLGRVLSTRGPNKGAPVYAGGFPGPEMHWLMYQRLKERSLEQIRNGLVSNPFRERVIFLAGRRRSESARRASRANAQEIMPLERKGSIVWASPLFNWSALDMNDYRRAHPGIPRNEVAALLHMSGECLCGCYAKPGELDEIGDWFPSVAAWIRGLEAEARTAGIPQRLCKWGFGAGPWRPSRTGPLCSSCDARFQQLELPEES